jgi:hypothetical protein
MLLQFVLRAWPIRTAVWNLPPGSLGKELLIFYTAL